MNKENKNFDYKRLHPFKWFILENYPFLEDSIDVLTNYQLFCKLGEMYNKQVDAINTLGIQVEGITDWFDDLDVQEEVNNKLDAMAESGELEEIISSYLNTKSILCFDTVSAMEESENLIDGSYARTLGYYTKNDGGGALYKIRTITNDDVVDEMTILEMEDNTLIAELIVENNTITSNQIGCKTNDNTFNNGTKLNSIANYCNNNGYKLFINTGVYYLNTPISVSGCKSLIIEGENQKSGISNTDGTLLIYTGSDYCFNFTNGSNHLKLYNFNLRCNEDNSGINITCSNEYTNFKDEITNVSVSNAIIGLNLSRTAYFFVNNYTFFGCSSTDYGILLDAYEFTYFNHCSIDGASETDNSSSAIKITGGLNTYFDNCDFCNFASGSSIYLQSDKALYLNYFNNCNVIRCDGGIIFNPTSEYITQISFDKLAYNITGQSASDKIFYFYKNSTTTSQRISIRNLDIRTLSTSALPSFLVDGVAGAVQYLDVDIASTIGFTNLGVNTGSNITYKSNYNSRNGTLAKTADSTTTRFEFSIPYPKINVDRNLFVIVNYISNPYRIGSITYDNTDHSYKFAVVFDSAPTSNFLVKYFISE